MKKVFLTYTDSKFDKQKKAALLFAWLFGNFDKVIGTSPQNIHQIFKNKYQEILSAPKGGGYWLWKPYIINKTLKKLNHGDFLFYSDASSIFLKKVDILIQELDKHNQDIMGFELPLIEEQWTKPDLFINMGCEGEKYSRSNQIMASFILIKKSVNSEIFIKQYLDYACDKTNLTDLENDKVIKSECLIDHRYDQSIFSLLYKKYNLHPFKDPSQYGNDPNGYSGISQEIDDNNLHILKNGRKFRINKYEETYNLVIYLYRRSNIKVIIKFMVKNILLKKQYILWFVFSTHILIK